MIRFVGTALLILFSYLLQSCVLGMLPFLNSVPNLLLIVTFTIGVLRGREEGMIVGACSGLLLDLFSGGYLGFYGLIYMYIGFFCGFLCQRMDADMPLVPIALCFVSQFFYHGYIFVFRFLLRGRLNILSYLNSIILPELVLTTVCALFLYGVLLLTNNALEEYEKRSSLKFV